MTKSDVIYRLIYDGLNTYFPDHKQRTGWDVKLYLLSILKYDVEPALKEAAMYGIDKIFMKAGYINADVCNNLNSYIISVAMSPTFVHGGVTVDKNNLIATWIAIKRIIVSDRIY